MEARGGSRYQRRRRLYEQRRQHDKPDLVDPVRLALLQDEVKRSRARESQLRSEIAALEAEVYGAQAYSQDEIVRELEAAIDGHHGLAQVPAGPTRAPRFFGT